MSFRTSSAALEGPGRPLTTGALELGKGPPTCAHEGLGLHTTASQFLGSMAARSHRIPQSVTAAREEAKWTRQGIHSGRGLGLLPTLALEAAQSRGWTEVLEPLSEQLPHRGVVSAYLAKQGDYVGRGGPPQLLSSTLSPLAPLSGSGCHSHSLLPFIMLWCEAASCCP